MANFRLIINPKSIPIMKTKTLWAIPIAFFVLVSAQVASPRYEMTSSITGVYDGNEGYGYYFIVKHPTKNTEKTMTFQHISPEVLSTYNLDGLAFINKKFDITYTLQTETTLDENGYEDKEDIYTIIKLKPMQ